MLVRDGERALLARAERNRICDETRNDRTRQRTFERRFESRDLPDSRAAFADASDAGWMSRMIERSLDAEYRRWAREFRLQSAAASLPRRPGMLRRLLWAIYRNGRERSVTMAELNMPARTYWWGVKNLLKFFSAQ
ncbi:MAG: hypothetical protein K6F50_09480 [Kiritimatiellae bacterium]|nr:hypothetical protein [Kiritimatiellia bacterium]